MGSFQVIENRGGAGEGFSHELRLKPIDHSCAFSGSVEDLLQDDFAWVYLDALRQAFSEEERDYIKRLDVKGDAAIMRDAGFSQSHIDQMILGTVLLQEGAKAGLSAQQMGEMMTDKSAETPTIQMILRTSGKYANEAMKSGSTLSIEQHDDYRDELFLQNAILHVRRLIGGEPS